MPIFTSLSVIISLVIFSIKFRCICSTHSIEYKCLSMDSSSSTRMFQTNLMLLLSSMISKAPSNSGLFTIFIGETPHRAHGLVLCRGNITSGECRSCLRTVTSSVKKHCMDTTQGLVRHNHCLACYNNHECPCAINRKDCLYKPGTKEEWFNGLVKDFKGHDHHALFELPVHKARRLLSQTAYYSRSGYFTVGALSPSSNISNVPYVTAPPSSNDRNVPYVTVPPSSNDSNVPYVPTPPSPRTTRNTSTSPPPKATPVPPEPPSASIPPSSPALGPAVVTTKRKSTLALFLKIGGSILCVVILAATIVLFFQYRKRTGSRIQIYFGARKHDISVDVEMLIKNGSLAPKRYKYSGLKKITNSFQEKIGQGGYGSVYKGKLPDGRLVAVKILSETKGNGEEFINEVASIGKTYHVNVVSLLGYCFEESKRALIYEFMPNGSLDKYIYGEKPRTMHPLGWEKLFQIALDIARGLEYLHLRCSTRILHLDIKPHNILLNENFCPKISDFGLAKLCSLKDSTLSMPPRGTVGYTAPEVHGRKVSYKSDVYSYGMMVLEMVGGRKNIETDGNTSEIYFPRWIYKHLIEMASDIQIEGVSNDAEKEMASKMTIIGLWCIQKNPMDRPLMSEVVEMFQGSIESLQMPPNPFTAPL